MTATANPTIARKLAEVRERIRVARDHVAAARQERKDAVSAWDGTVDQNSGGYRAADNAAQALQKAEQDLRLLQEEERFYLSQVAGMSDSILGGESFLRDPEVLRNLAQLASSSMPVGNLNLGPAFSRDEILYEFDRGRALATSGPIDYPSGQGRTSQFFGIVPQLRRPLRVLDLIPSAPLDNKTLPYVQESGNLDTAAETAEFAIKPEGEMGLTDADAVARTIAHWIKAPRQTLADLAGLESAIQNRLMYGVLRRLESQLLAGDGTGENILGILATTGIGSVTYDAGELAADQTLEGIVDVLLSNAQPTGVIVNPRDWAAMLNAKSSGSGEYLSLGPFVQTAQNLWGTPAIPSPAIAQGTALVGDFSIGATVLVREGVNVRLSDSDSDDFTRNRVTILGEGRWAVAVWQPSAFAVVHLAA